MIVYKVTNLINGKIYVGKTAYSLSIRKTQHLSDVKTERRNSALHKAIKKYGNENFTWEIIDRCLFAESLIALEKHYIEFFNCMSPNGYNLTAGGEGALGFRQSPETIQRMREIHRNISDETRLKMSASHVGKRPSMETRKKMSSWQIGRKFSDETKKRIAEAKRNISEETRIKMSDSAKKRGYSPENIARLAVLNTGKKLSSEHAKKFTAAGLAARLKNRQSQVLN